MALERALAQTVEELEALRRRNADLVADSELVKASAWRENVHLKEQLLVTEREVRSLSEKLDASWAFATEQLRESFRYQFGHIMVEAVSKPSLKTLILPWSIARLIFTQLRPAKKSASSNKEIKYLREQVGVLTEKLRTAEKQLIETGAEADEASQ